MTGRRGSGRDAVARDVIDTAWLGPRLLRTAGSSQPPFPRGICLLAANTTSVRADVAHDPVTTCGSALSPDGRCSRSLVLRLTSNRGRPIALFDAGTGALVRTLTTGAGDGVRRFSPDGRRVVFSRGSEIYVMPRRHAGEREERRIKRRAAGLGERRRRLPRATLGARIARGDRQVRRARRPPAA